MQGLGGIRRLITLASVALSEAERLEGTDTPESYFNVWVASRRLKEAYEVAEALYVARPLCECEWEDDGDGESGPHLTLVRVSPNCPWPEHVRCTCEGEAADFNCVRHGEEAIENG